MNSQSLANGQLQAGSTWGKYNNIAFAIQQALAKMQTATLVRIEKCTNSGGLSPVGFVDVTPLVDQIDGEGKPVPHVTIFNLPYFRLQGGGNAVIIDPQPGDIGLAVFASRDISKIKTTKAAAPPGSLRQFSFSDGIYVGGLLNGVPTQYVQFSSVGIKMHSPAAIVLDAPDIQLTGATVEVNASTSATVTTPTFTVNGTTQFNGNITQGGGVGVTASFSGSMAVTGDVTANGTSVHTHVHSDPQGGNTSAPL